ncbi:MAG: glycine cleavage system protein GcvH [Phycisphaerales bacterium]|nr:glycine cleavage system protein GcvH [Phycisphaerales bacterium]
MSTPSDRLYSESHEWYQVSGETVTIGITQYAANELTDITYVEMQSPGTAITAGDSLGEVESVKTTSDVYSPFTGEISEINEAAAGDPAVLNRDPYGNGWLVRLNVVDATAPDTLMDQATYDERYPLI